MDTEVRDAEAGLTGSPRPQRPRSSVPSFLFISFMLFMLTSHNGDEFLARHQYQDALRSLTYQLSNYTAWLNGTTSNFTIPDQPPALSSLLDIFHVRGSVLDAYKESYYSNITGFIHGNSEFYNITPGAATQNESLPWRPFAESYMTGINITSVVQRSVSWNWTASSKVALSVVEKKPVGKNLTEGIALVHGRIEFTDINTSEDLRLEFEGIHFVLNGSIHGFAEPVGRHIDIRLLPSIVPEEVRNETAQLIQPELEARIEKLKNLIDAGILDQDSNGSDDPPKTTCPFTFHAQIDAAPVPEYLMRELEQETLNPTGIWTVVPPKLSIKGVLLSRECGILYEVVKTEGLRSRTFFRKVTTYAGVAGVAYLVLLILFTRQADHSRTPSGIYRVSRWTFLAQSTVDSVSFAGHITFAILAEGKTSLSLIAPAFLACILFIHEAQFSVLIHQIQGPEGISGSTVTPLPPAALPSPTLNNTPAPAPSDVVAPPPNTVSSLPTQQAPTPTASPPSFFSFFVQHVRTDPQARLWLTLFIFLTFIVRIILSPTLSMIFVTITYSFIWFPQIVRSARRGRSSGLRKEYIIGTTLCRLYSALYFLACPKNVLEIEPRGWSYLLALFVCLQGLVLILQELLGPTFFLPQKYGAVQMYDYHPSMPLPDSEAPEQSLGDCAICMDAIVVDSSRRRSKSMEDIDTKESGALKRKAVGGTGGILKAMHIGVGGSTARKNYSLAPCHHLFHTDCLEKWLAIKNICPQCRRPLPPL